MARLQIGSPAFPGPLDALPDDSILALDPDTRADRLAFMAAATDAHADSVARALFLIGALTDDKDLRDPAQAIPATGDVSGVGLLQAIDNARRNAIKADALAWAAANPQTGRKYLAVCGDQTDGMAFVGDTALPALTDGIDLRAVVRYRGGVEDEEDGIWLEVGTHTADGGIGDDDSPEAALWVDTARNLQAYYEAMATAESGETNVVGGYGPLAGIPMLLRWTQDTATGTAATWIASDRGTEVTEIGLGSRWVQLSSRTDAGFESIYSSPDPWAIGRGGGQGGVPLLDIFDWEVHHGIDGPIVAKPDIQNPDSATVVPDLVLASGAAVWTATDAEVITP